MSGVLKHEKIVIYADDTTLYISGPTISDVKMKFQSDFNAVCKWIKCNKLHWNVDKN